MQVLHQLIGVGHIHARRLDRKCCPVADDQIEVGHIVHLGGDDARDVHSDRLFDKWRGESQKTQSPASISISVEDLVRKRATKRSLDWASCNPLGVIDS